VSQLYDLPFDQYQRYQLVSTLVEELRPRGEALEILDVGGRTALLRSFLTKDRVTLVDLEPSAEPGLVLGDGSALPFADASFDLVCAFDTLEHVPPTRRAQFVRECARVARRWVVLAGPYQSDEVEEAEKLLQQFLREKLQVHHRYLEEHRHNGLPDRAATERELQDLGARVVSLGHGNVQRWLALISFALYMDHTPALQAQAVRLHRFYNRGLFAEDQDPPVYRHAVVAALGDAALPRARRARTSAHAPARELVHFAQELAAFDAQRDGHRAEFERLQGVIRDLTADLAGHQRSLKELSERRTESQAEIATLRADLDGHRRSLRETSALRAEAEKAIATLQNDLAGHRRSLQETSALRSEAEKVVASLQSDVAALEAEHKKLLDLRQSERKDFEGILAARDAEIARRIEVQGALERELAEHRKVVADLGADLAGHRALVAAQQGEIRARDEQLAARAQELADVRGALERARGELAAAASALEQKEQLIGLLRADLKSRLRSLSRALGPARPTAGE